MLRLGVNIDHVATLRQARGTLYPSPVQAATLAEMGGADNITCHLREDRRHIQDRDVWLLKETINVPLNFEMGCTTEMVAFAKKLKPHAVTLVPEKREEKTTEGGLDLKRQFKNLKQATHSLQDLGVLVSLFVEPSIEAVEGAQKIGALAVEFHTGKFCTEIDQATTSEHKHQLIQQLITVSRLAHDLNIQSHFGHGLHYHNASWLQWIPFAEEANIGHSIVSRAIFCGLTDAVKDMKRLLNDSGLKPY